MYASFCMSMVFLQIIVFSSSESRSDVALTVTDCPPIELEYHVAMFTLQLSKSVDSPVTFHLTSNHPDIAYPLQPNVTFQPSDGVIPKILFVYGSKIGRAEINIKFNESLIHVSKSFVSVCVVHSLILTFVSNIFGWIYFAAWTISFYPQVIENYRHKSVVGLSFDYLCYNLVGYFMYSVFNIGLYFFSAIQDEYFNKYGGSVIPVLPNDVFVSIHAVIISCLTIAQCFIYEKGDQHISLTCKVVTGLLLLFALCSLIPTLLSYITWLSYIGFCSYIKIGIVLIKLLPQIYMNHRRRSTVGFSMEAVLIDFVGGCFSLAQMFMLSYNNNEWNSIFGDFTKFFLGLFSILLDMVFILQHYVFYQKPLGVKEIGKYKCVNAA